MTKTTKNQQRTLCKTKPNKAKVKIGKMGISIETIMDYDKNNKQSTTNVIQNKANFKRDLAKMGHHEPVRIDR